MKDCPKCGNRVADNALFCGSCGATISAKPTKGTPAKAKPADKSLCPNCGMPRNQSGKFCLGCGTALDPDALAGIKTTPYNPQKGGFLRFVCAVLCAIMFFTMLGNAVSSPASSLRRSFTITVWAPKDDQLEGNNWLVDRQTQFAAMYPDYDITWVNEAYNESDVANQFRNGDENPPDVYMFTSDYLHDLVTYGALTPLSSYYTSMVRSSNGTVAENSVSYSDGDMYGFPLTPNTWCLYYDKTVFTEKDVQSLEDMLAKGKVYLPLNNAWSGGCFFLGTGCTIFGEDGLDNFAGFDFGGDKGYDAAKKMLGVKNNPNAVIGDMDIYKLLNREVGAVFTGSWYYNDLKDALGDDLGIAPLPSFTYNGETYQMTAMSTTKCVGVNPSTTTDSFKQSVCMDFAAFLASEESQIARYKVNGKVPVASSLLNNDNFTDDELVQAEIKTMEYCSVLQSSLPKMKNYWTPMGNFLSALMDGRVTVQNYKQAVDLLNEELNA